MKFNSKLKKIEKKKYLVVTVSGLTEDSKPLLILKGKKIK
jgi:hypothetical protein